MTSIEDVNSFFSRYTTSNNLISTGKEDAATCLGGNGTWGGRAKVFGTVPVCVRVQERVGGEGFMATSIISISSDSLEESVESSTSRGVIFGTIPTIIHTDVSTIVPDVLEVAAAIVALPTGVLDLDIHSTSETDPFEVLSSLDHAPATPIIYLFLHSSDSSEAFDDSSGGGSFESLSSLDSHEVVARWRDKVASRYVSSSSPSSSSTHSLPSSNIASPTPSNRKGFHSLSSSPPRKRHKASSYLSSSYSPGSTAYDLPAPYRFIDPHLVRNPQDNEAYRRWRAAPLPIVYPPTTFELSSRDLSSDSSTSSFERPPPRSSATHSPAPSSSAGPSRKRCRSPTTSVPLATPTPGALSPARVDLLPPHKRIRGFLAASSLEDGSKGSMEVDDEIKVETEVGLERDDKANDEAESSDKGTIEIEVDRFVELKMHADSLVSASDEGSKENFKIGLDVVIQELTMTITRSRMTPKAIKEMITRCVAEALAEQEANRNLRPIVESENRDDNENRNGGGHRNGNRGCGNGNGNQGVNAGGTGIAAHECTHKEFLNCQPFNFNGTEGAARLARWFEKMELVFHISNCPPKYQVKYASCTMQNGALTWWNAYKRTIETEAAYALTWTKLMKLMIEMVPEEEDRVERYIWGLPDNIQRNITLFAPIRLQDAIRIANNLIDQKVRTNPARQVDNKQKWESESRDNHAPQQPFRRPDVARVYTTENNKRSGYAGSYPYCNKCRLYHAGPCIVKCTNCKKTSHMVRDCKNQAATTNQRALVYNQRALMYNQRTPVNNHRALVANHRASVTCYECGRWGHYHHNCPKVKNQNRDVSYAIELADGKVVESDIILRGCTLNFLNHPFNIDLMTVELGSFDIITGMDWLSKYHALIVCDEKVTEKKTEDKSEEKRLEDVPIMRDFLKVFPKDLPGLPPT
nr:hypothetical protein [Tanacetum cinerariifolium]